jgi:hypothetical protein
LTTNNVLKSLLIYSLTLTGSDEIRRGEDGYCTLTRAITAQILFPACPESARLKSHCYDEVPYDEIIPAVFHLVVNSHPIIDKGECTCAAFGRDLAASESDAAGEEEHQEVPGRQMSNEHLAAAIQQSPDRTFLGHQIGFV